MTCSCGRNHHHVIAHRMTSDDRVVEVYEDGVVTGGDGVRIPGIPIRRVRDPRTWDLQRTAGNLFAGEVCLYTYDELPLLYRMCERAARLDGRPGTVRRLFGEAEKAVQRIPLAWSTIAADRDGRPRERCAMLSRLRWPGLAVWDFCGSHGSVGGRYAVMSRLRRGRHADDSFTDTGARFHTLDALFVYLHSVPAPEYQREGALK